MNISRLEAARRQLNCAIWLFFNDGDPVSVHTLAGAASVVLTDLVEISKPGESWDSYAQEETGLSRKDYFQITRNVQNFFKHADREPDKVLEFNVEDTEHLLLFASLNSGVLNAEGEFNSHEISTFQTWYIASHREKIPEETGLVPIASQLFPDFPRLSRSERIKLGQQELRNI